MQPSEDVDNGSTIMDLNENIRITFQKLREEDEASISNFLFGLSQQSIYYRFISHNKFTVPKIKEMIATDLSEMKQHNAISLIGSIMDTRQGKETIAMGAYYPEDSNRKAEVAIVVGDIWQRKTIGSFLFKTLAVLAKHNGIAHFTALVCVKNIAMQKVIEKIDLPLLRHVEDALYYYEIDLTAYQ
ncbi:MAG: hypothetical protein HQL87_10045 [Magnetococcales bacterium]|nr:hypothetical protein [Magnetococcales bacterium]